MCYTRLSRTNKNLSISFQTTIKNNSERETVKKLKQLAEYIENNSMGILI